MTETPLKAFSASQVVTRRSSPGSPPTRSSHREPGLFTFQKNARPGTHSEAGKIQEIVAVSMALLLRSVKLRLRERERRRDITKNKKHSLRSRPKQLKCWQRGVEQCSTASERFCSGHELDVRIGVIGCLFVIPITAYRLFAVLFDEDRSDEE